VITVLSFSDEGNILVYRDPVNPGFFVEQLGPVGLDTVDYQALSQAKLGNFLYAAGGYDGTYSSTNRVFRFDPRYRDWSEVAGMNGATSWGSVSNSSGSIRGNRICRSNDSRCSFLSSGFALTQLTITSSTNLSEASIYMFSIRNCNNSSKDKFG
jgi:hypothetical protein